MDPAGNMTWLETATPCFVMLGYPYYLFQSFDAFIRGYSILQYVQVLRQNGHNGGQLLTFTSVNN